MHFTFVEDFCYLLELVNDDGAEECRYMRVCSYGLKYFTFHHIISTNFIVLIFSPNYLGHTKKKGRIISKWKESHKLFCIYK